MDRSTRQSTTDNSNPTLPRQALYDSLKSMRRQKSGPVTVLSYAYFTLLIIIMMIAGPSLIPYLLFILLAGLFILPDNHLLGLSLIIVLTMVFERYFTLQGLMIDKSVYKFYLIDVIICFSWLALFINRKLSRTASKAIFGWPEKLLLLWLLLVAAYLIRSIFDINADFSTSFSSFKNYFFYPLLYFFIIFAIDSGKKLKDIIQLILLAGVGLIGFIFIGFISGQGLWTQFTPLSTVGTRYLAGTHAYYLALALALGLPLLLYKRLRNKPFAVTVMGLWGLGITVSLMRHLWLALAAALFTIFIFLTKELKKAYLIFLGQIGLAIAAAAAILIMGVSLLYFQGSLDNVYQDLTALSSRVATVTDLSSDSSAAWRQNVWYDAEKIWITNPVFGVGFGHVMLVEHESYQSFEEIRNIHNSPLAITVQMGLIGLLALAAFILSVLLSSLPRLHNNEDLTPYYLGLIAGIVVILVACVFQPYLETNLMGIWLWLLLGLLRTSGLNKSQI